MPTPSSEHANLDLLDAAPALIREAIKCVLDLPCSHHDALEACARRLEHRGSQTDAELLAVSRIIGAIADEIPIRANLDGLFGFTLRLIAVELLLLRGRGRV